MRSETGSKLRQTAMDSADAGKAILVRIVSMLVGLIPGTSSSRVYEESSKYAAEFSE